MDEQRTPAAVRIDQIRANHRAGLIDRAEAVEGIRATVNVTEEGATDLLDDPRPATERYRP